MASKRRPLHQPGANFRPSGPEVTRADAKGTRPTAAPTSIKEVLLMMVMHVCKKSIFFDTNLKVALYLGSVFLVSLIGDFLPFPKTYLARRDNLFNLYFVKIGWGWTLMLMVPFVVMTAYTLCCGDTKRLVRNHLPRIAIATFFWFFWTKMFNVIETSFGRCTIKGFQTKSQCLKAGHLWNGFDISGHTFILIYSSLVLIEEARPIVKWEGIREHLRNEVHNRRTSGSVGGINPLRNLDERQMKELQFLYTRLTPAIRTLFIGITALQLLWDIMLVGTMLYFHNMVEKVTAGIIAILTWYFTYRFWYRTKLLPDHAGSGVFDYQTEAREGVPLRRTNAAARDAASSAFAANAAYGAASGAGGAASGTTKMPSFMGMPLYYNPGGRSTVVSNQNSSQPVDMSS